MRPVTFMEEYDPGLQQRVRERYAAVTLALAALGFRELCCYSEVLANYSLVLSLPVVILMRMKGEVLKRRPRLRASASYLLHHHPRPQTIALPLGLGVKFYTGFKDGTVLITANFASQAVARRGSQVLKHARTMPVPEAWQTHQRRVEHAATARPLVSGYSFAAFVAMAQQEERGCVMRGSRQAAPDEGGLHEQG
jgi:hypothetical protein